MTWQHFQQRAAFITSMIVGVIFLLISAAEDAGWFSKASTRPPSAWGMFIFYLLAFACTVLGVFGLARRGFSGTKWGHFGNYIAWLLTAFTIVVFGSLRFNLGLGLDKQSVAFGLLIAVASLTIGLSFTLFSMENRLVEKFDEVRRQAISKGVLVHVDNASLWSFQGVIVGWNPNWALELKTHPNNEFFDQLKQVHRARLDHGEVKRIEYIFLNNYDPTGSDELLFGVDAFLRFLTTSFHDDGNSLAVDKYYIWEIGEDVWKGCDPGLSADKKELLDAIKPFLNVIVIAGTRNGRDHAIMFFNIPQFIDVSGHTHCLEIHDDQFEFYASWHYIRDKMTRCGIETKKVEWDVASETFQLAPRSPAGGPPPAI